MILEHYSKNKKTLLLIFTLLLILGVVYLITNYNKQGLSQPASKQNIEQAFIAKYPNWDKPGYFNVDIEENSATHAMGQVSWPGNERHGLWFAANVDGDWLITDYTGGGYFGMCQNFKEYNFPQDMISDCWDEEKKILVNTANPERFYNGLTVQDKEKIVQAFLEYREGDDNFMSKELYVRFDKYLGGYLTGMILIGGVDNYSTPYFLAAKTGDVWKVLYWGQEAPPCESLEGYNVPVELAPSCWANNGTEYIDR